MLEKELAASKASQEAAVMKKENEIRAELQPKIDAAFEKGWARAKEMLQQLSSMQKSMFGS